MKNLKRFLFIGTILYVAFLAWFLTELKSNAVRNWNPSDIYSEVGDCSFSTTTSPAPMAYQIFEGKLDVPIKKAKSRPRRRSSSYSSVPMLLSPLGQGRAYAVTPVGEALHAVSSAQFRSFGAGWMMYMSMPQHFMRRSAEVVEQSSQVSPWLLVPSVVSMPGAVVSSQDPASTVSVVSVPVQSISSRLR